jgi:excisionase family DNA binding protein
MMEDFITTKQLQEILQIDRTTLYRMLSDGRLTGIRVGGQWRFPRNGIEQCLTNSKTGKTLSVPESVSPGVDVLPIDCLEPIQEVFATAADVGAVTTTLEGNPLTTVSNSCRFCDLILASPEGRKRCEASWMRLAQATDRAPHIEQCHAGLGYARGRIQIADEFVAMTFAGQFVASESARQALRVSELARECNIPEADLQQAAAELRIVEPARAKWLLTLLQKVAVTFSHIGEQRLDLLKRLRQVSQLAQV